MDIIYIIGAVFVGLLVGFFISKILQDKLFKSKVKEAEEKK